MIAVDCTTHIPQLSGSEFFGHERGAFTGAVASRDGAFALADKGTLFLDEIGELLLELQAQLLRVIGENTFKKIGGNIWEKTDFRLICATNKDLAQLVSAGKFRADLYYRIAGWIIRLPSLNERIEDIMHLAKYFITQNNPSGEILEIDDAVYYYLTVGLTANNE